MREHLGIGLRLEHDALSFQACPQLRCVLDDAVVHDRVTVRGVAVRMRIAVARFAVRGPARMCDTGAAAQLLRQSRSRARGPCLCSCGCAACRCARRRALPSRSRGIRADAVLASGSVPHRAGRYSRRFHTLRESPVQP